MNKGGSDIVVHNIQLLLGLGLNPEHENSILKKEAQEVCSTLHKNGQLAYMLKARQQNGRPTLAGQ